MIGRMAKPIAGDQLTAGFINHMKPTIGTIRASGSSLRHPNPASLPASSVRKIGVHHQQVRSL
jgi:hypothetical protein